MNKPDKAPAFMLAKKGYDVWLGNQRGTKHSRSHKTLNPEVDHAYWRFSFPEMGRYDAQAQVDYVRNLTGREKISYIGHSMGTTQLFTELSINQTYWE